MNDLLAFLLVMCFGVLAINLPVYFFLLYRLNSYIQVNHHALWKSKGSPTILTNNSISNSSSMVSFILSKEYLKSDDGGVRARGARCRVSLLVGLGAFTIGVSLLFIL